MCVIETHFGFEVNGKSSTTVDLKHGNISGQTICTRGKRYMWDVKVNVGQQIWIGVSNTDGGVYVYDSWGCTSYSYDNMAQHCEIHNDTVGYGDGDIITVILDLRDNNDSDVDTDGKLLFCLNGRNDFGVEFDDLPKSACYRLHVINYGGKMLNITILSACEHL